MYATTTHFQLGRWAHQNRRVLVNLFAFSVFALLCWAMFQDAFAAPAAADEFTGSAAKFEGWVKGNLGKTAGFVALSVGAVVAAVKKDWSWFFGAIILAMGIGIMAGIINASFTAQI